MTNTRKLARWLLNTDEPWPFGQTLYRTLTVLATLVLLFPKQSFREAYVARDYARLMGQATGGVILAAPIGWGMAIVAKRTRRNGGSE